MFLNTLVSRACLFVCLCFRCFCFDKATWRAKEIENAMSASFRVFFSSIFTQMDKSMKHSCFKNAACKFNYDLPRVKYMKT